MSLSWASQKFMVGVLHLLTLKIQKTLNKSFAKLYQASVALLGSQNRESIGNSLFIHCILVKKQGTGLGGDISISKVVELKNSREPNPYSKIQAILPCYM